MHHEDACYTVTCISCIWQLNQQENFIAEGQTSLHGTKAFNKCVFEEPEKAVLEGMFYNV